MTLEEENETMSMITPQMLEDVKTNMLLALEEAVPGYKEILAKWGAAVHCNVELVRAY